jgi:hypothetical protein
MGMTKRCAPLFEVIFPGALMPGVDQFISAEICGQRRIMEIPNRLPDRHGFEHRRRAKVHAAQSAREISARVSFRVLWAQTFYFPPLPDPAEEFALRRCL